MPVVLARTVEVSSMRCDEETPHLGPGPLVVAALRPLDGGDGVLVVHVEVDDPPRPPRGKGNPPLDLLAVQHDVALARGERTVGDIGPHPELRGGVAVEPPGTQVPRQDRALVNALGRVGDQGPGVDLGPHAQAVAGGARAVGVEGEGLGAGGLEVRAAHGAHDLHLLRRDRGPDAVAVRAQVRPQPRHHQARDVEDLGHGPDGAARAGHRRALAERQRGRQVVDPVHGRALGLAQPPAAVGAQGLQEAVHALGVQGADGQRGLPGSGYADDGDGLPQRNVHVHVPQVVVPGAAYLDGARQAAPIRTHRPIRTLACDAEDSGAELVAGRRSRDRPGAEDYAAPGASRLPQ
jgi:hypothetical protein